MNNLIGKGNSKGRCITPCITPVNTSVIQKENVDLKEMLINGDKKNE